MKFAEHLSEYRSSRFAGHLHRILVAEEVACYMSSSDNYFELVCEYIYDWYMNSSISAAEAAQYFFTALHNGDFDLDSFSICMANGNVKQIDSACERYF